ncbi:hypothetical protein [Parasphingorhabdus sp.]|uniref:hypothetical protein n=1 Tax=Parasphingorhabdus sp. TaxID=2709688 RepID=UPI003A8ED2BF
MLIKMRLTFYEVRRSGTSVNQLADNIGIARNAARIVCFYIRKARDGSNGNYRPAFLTGMNKSPELRWIARKRAAPTIRSAPNGLLVYQLNIKAMFFHLEAGKRDFRDLHNLITNKRHRNLKTRCSKSSKSLGANT